MAKKLEAEREKKRRSEAFKRRREQAQAAAKLAGRRCVLRLPDVEVMVGRRKSAILDDVAAGLFPKPIPLGGRAVGWLQDEVEFWIEDRIAERDRAA